MNTQIIKITTEGDCEGKSIRTVGLFIGSVDQIITYLISKNIKPYYGFYADNIDVIDCSEIKPEVEVTVGSYGKLVYTTPETLKLQAARSEALSKLSPTERKLLGLE